MSKNISFTERSQKLMHFWRCIIAVIVMLFICTPPTYVHGENANITAQIAEVKDNFPAIYTLISDDGFYDSGVILNELAQKLNIRVTVAGYSRRINLNLDEWRQIESQGHVEIVSHSYSHIKMVDEASITDDIFYREIYESRLFTEHAFNKSMIAFVAPNNKMSKRGYDFLNAAGYFAVRREARGENPLNPQEGCEAFQWFNLGCRGIGDVKSTSERNAWIDSAIANGTWLIEMWHDISPNGDVGYQPISTEMAENHLKYAVYQREQGNLWIASFQDAVRYLREKQNAEIEIIKATPTEAVLNLTCDRDKLPIEIFSDPLTLNIHVPEDWDYVFAFQNGRACEVTRLDDSSISLNAIPDGGEITIRSLSEMR